MRDSRHWAEITVQSMFNVLERWHCILHMWTLHERCTSHPCWICSPSQIFTSLRADHTVTGTGRNQVAENTTMQINFKQGVERRNAKTFTIVSSATNSSEKRWSSWVALRSPLRSIDLQVKTTVILPHKKKLMSIVVIGGSVRMWWISIRYRQGVNLTSKKHCRHCTVPRERRTRNTMKIGRKVPFHGANGKLPGGIPIMRLHYKDHLQNGKLVYLVNQLFICDMTLSIWCKIYRDYIGNSQRSLLSPTGGVNFSWYSNSRTKWLRKSV